MARINAGQAQHEAVKLAASLMAAAARTAPKARGLDSIETLILDGEDLEALAAAMGFPLSVTGKSPYFDR